MTETEAEATLPQMIRMNDICARLGVKRSTIYRWIEKNEFPRPVPMADRVIAFEQDKVLAWWESKKGRQRAAPLPMPSKPVRRRDEPRAPRKRSG